MDKSRGIQANSFGKQIAEIFDFKTRTSSKLCSDWVTSGFLEINDPSRKNRKYTLAKKYKSLVEED
jgi:hypothetical protein